MDPFLFILLRSQSRVQLILVVIKCLTGLKFEEALRLLQSLSVSIKKNWRKSRKKISRNDIYVALDEIFPIFYTQFPSLPLIWKIYVYFYDVHESNCHFDRKLSLIFWPIFTRRWRWTTKYRDPRYFMLTFTSVKITLHHFFVYYLYHPNFLVRNSSARKSTRLFIFYFFRSFAYYINHHHVLDCWVFGKTFDYGSFFFINV